MVPAYAKQLQIIKNDEIEEGYKPSAEGETCQLCRIVDITDENVNGTIRDFYDYVKKQMIYCGNQAFCTHVANKFNNVSGPPSHNHILIERQAIVRADKVHCKRM